MAQPYITVLRGLGLVLPDGLQIQVLAPFGSADTPPFPRITFSKAQATTTAFLYIQTRPSFFFACFTIGCSLEPGDSVRLNGLLFSIWAVLDGFE